MLPFLQRCGLMPTPARVVLFCGVLVLALAVTNASLADVITPELQRAEVLAGLAAVGLMLISALWTQAVPRSADQAVLIGEQGLVLIDQLSSPVKEELGWVVTCCLQPPQRQQF